MCIWWLQCTESIDLKYAPNEHILKSTLVVFIIQNVSNNDMSAQNEINSLI
jgi:hypothetical protein